MKRYAIFSRSAGIRVHVRPMTRSGAISLHTRTGRLSRSRLASLRRQGEEARSSREIGGRLACAVVARACGKFPGCREIVRAAAAQGAQLPLLSH